MREPSRLLCRSMYSFTPVRNSMKLRVTVSRKMRVETAQNTKVCAAVSGPYSPKLNETCQTTSVTRIASSARPEPKRYRFRIGRSIIRYSDEACPLQAPRWSFRFRLPPQLQPGEILPSDFALGGAF